MIQDKILYHMGYLNLSGKDVYFTRQIYITYVIQYLVLLYPLCILYQTDLDNHVIQYLVLFHLCILYQTDLYNLCDTVSCLVVSFMYTLNDTRQDTVSHGLSKPVW
jgi:hypothetical protein